MKNKQDIGNFAQGNTMHFPNFEVMRIKTSEEIGQVCGVSPDLKLDVMLKDGTKLKDLCWADLEEVSGGEKEKFQRNNPHYLC